MSQIASQTNESLRSCPHCGLIQVVPRIPKRMRACCARCEGTLREPTIARHSNSSTAAIATAALILYPLAVTLPMISITQFGHESQSSILAGISTLFGRGHLLIGSIVLICSLILPVIKLASLLLLSIGGSAMQHRHRALTYRLIEYTGRWGMLDVLLVAILVAVLKLGDLVEVSAGPAALAFGLCVLLSLLAAAIYDPHQLWESQA